MDESIVNTQHTDEAAKEPVFCTESLMDLGFFTEFNSISYNTYKKWLFAFLVLTVWYLVTYIWLGNYDVFLVALSMPIVVSYMYYVVAKAPKRNYERRLISAGEEETFYGKLYEDKIVWGVKELERNYSYHQIRKLYETKRFLILQMQMNLHLIVDKAAMNADVDEAKAFLIQKCTLVKRKKFVDCSNDRKLSLIFLLLLIFSAAAGIVISLLLKHNVI